jgi:hypothetical protein
VSGKKDTLCFHHVNNHHQLIFWVKISWNHEFIHHVVHHAIMVACTVRPIYKSTNIYLPTDYSHGISFECPVQKSSGGCCLSSIETQPLLFWIWFTSEHEQHLRRLGRSSTNENNPIHDSIQKKAAIGHRLQYWKSSLPTPWWPVRCPINQTLQYVVLLFIQYGWQ